MNRALQKCKNMNCIIKEEQLVIQYNPGKGAWTYHLRIPNTKDIKGKWGDIKVSGLIDNYKVERKNLAPTKGSDKILSINNIIRQAIYKSAGDTVTVTLYLDPNNQSVDQASILECFQEAAVLDRFQLLSAEEKKSIINSILALPNEDKQVEKILYYIGRF